MKPQKSKPELNYYGRQEWLQCLQAAVMFVERHKTVYPENVQAVTAIADQFYAMLEERRAPKR